MSVLRIFLTILFVALLNADGIFSHRTTSYYGSVEDFDTSSKEYRRMVNSLRRMNDDMFVFELNYFGTHDTMTYLQRYPFVQTQTLNIQQQLRWGARFLDIRVKVREGRFRLFHGPINLGEWFDLVLEELKSFLTEYPHEYVIIGLQHEDWPENGMDDMCLILKQYIEKYQDIVWRGVFDNLRVGDVRGKVLIVGQEFFNNCPKTFDFNNCKKQMHWDLGLNWELHDEKWMRVKRFALEFRDSTNDYKQICGINFLGGSSSTLTVIPEFVVSGHGMWWLTNSNRLSTGLVDPIFTMYSDFPRTNCLFGLCTIAFEGTNVLHTEHFGNTIMRPRTSYVLVTDFAGPALPYAIFESNIKKMLIRTGGRCTEAEIMGDCCNNKRSVIEYNLALRNMTKNSSINGTGLSNNDALCVPRCVIDYSTNTMAHCNDTLMDYRRMTNNDKTSKSEEEHCELTYERRCDELFGLKCINIDCNEVEQDIWQFRNVSQNSCSLLKRSLMKADDEGDYKETPTYLPTYPLINLDNLLNRTLNDFAHMDKFYDLQINTSPIATVLVTSLKKELAFIKHKLIISWKRCQYEIPPTRDDRLCKSNVVYIDDNQNCIVYSECMNYNCQTVQSRDFIVTNKSIGIGDIDQIGYKQASIYKMTPKARITNDLSIFNSDVADCIENSKLYGKEGYMCDTSPTKAQCDKINTLRVI